MSYIKHFLATAEMEYQHCPYGLFFRLVALDFDAPTGKKDIFGEWVTPYEFMKQIRCSCNVTIQDVTSIMFPGRSKGDATYQTIDHPSAR